MSSTSGRAVAAIVTAIVAVLTGIAVGLLSPHRVCTVAVKTPAPAATATPPAATATPTGRQSVGLDPLQQSSAGQGAAPQAPPAGQPAPGAQQTTVVAVPGCVPSNFEAAPAALALLGVLATGLGVLTLLMLTGARRRPEARHSGTASPPASAMARTGAAPPAARRGDDAAVGAARLAESDRAALVQACIFVRDRTTSKALAERLGAALQQVGVTVVEPAGARFDPALHEAGGATPSSDPAKVGTIAAVEVPGYADRGHTLRAPVVTVYQGTEASRAREQK